MSLASKCMEPAFRMHLRAHSTVAKFFQALKDAPSQAVRNVFHLFKVNQSIHVKLL